MKYEEIWKKTLNESEKVEYEFSTAPRYRKMVFILWAVLGLFFMLVNPGMILLFLIAGAIHYWSLGLKVYALTQKRVLVHTGWLSTNSTSINYDKIVEVSVSETYSGKAFTKSGNLVIKTAGIGHDILLKNIEAPYEAKKALDRLSHHNAPGAAVPTTHAKTGAEQVAELFKLKQDGALTEDEFQAHKKKLLS